jgi:hypothetical protein
MERFGQVLGVDELNGADIHRMGNVMTMERGLHDFSTHLGYGSRQQYVVLPGFAKLMAE